MKRIPFGGLKPQLLSPLAPPPLRDNEENPLRGIETCTTLTSDGGSTALGDNEENPLRGIETHLTPEPTGGHQVKVTMKRIPFGGLKRAIAPVGNNSISVSDNEENPLRGIETSDLTPRPPSLRGKGEQGLPSPLRGGAGGGGSWT